MLRHHDQTQLPWPICHKQMVPCPLKEDLYIDGADDQVPDYANNHAGSPVEDAALEVGN